LDLLQTVGVFNEKIFQACSYGVREVVILDCCKEKYAEVFWDPITDSM